MTARLAAIATVRRGEFAQAVPLLERSLAAHPNDAELHGYLGVAHGQLGSVELAVNHLRAAVMLAPGVAALHYNLGHALERSGKPAEAVAAYLRARETGHPHAAEAARRLQSEALDRTQAIPSPPPPRTVRPPAAVPPAAAPTPQPQASPPPTPRTAPARAPVTPSPQEEGPGLEELSAFLAAVNSGAPVAPQPQQRWRSVVELLVVVLLVTVAALVIGQIAARL